MGISASAGPRWPRLSKGDYCKGLRKGHWRVIGRGFFRRDEADEAACRGPEAGMGGGGELRSYRGVALAGGQSPERVRTVKHDIDLVLALAAIGAVAKLYAVKQERG